MGEREKTARCCRCYIAGGVAAADDGDGDGCGGGCGGDGKF